MEDDKIDLDKLESCLRQTDYDSESINERIVKSKRQKYYNKGHMGEGERIPIKGGA
ncbi:hypothetical protein [Bacillus cereus]|uniref:hypothetical protein n=1 Tax=Bacillus cereus TaxID=1396 RepID=UPI0015CF5FE6|nr:hypothetical protein [Bacillus cereus]